MTGLSIGLLLGSKFGIVKWIWRLLPHVRSSSNRNAQEATISGRELESEVVTAGRGGSSSDHKLAEDLLSAAKAVDVAARVLVEATGGVVSGTGKLKQLIVAASTAQLFVSSRVKVDRDSNKFAELARCYRLVNRCTARFVATVKCWKATLKKNPRDLSHFSSHEAKKEKMGFQAHMLEVEEDLNKERTKLAELCEKHE